MCLQLVGSILAEKNHMNNQDYTFQISIKIQDLNNFLPFIHIKKKEKREIT